MLKLYWNITSDAKLSGVSGLSNILDTLTQVIQLRFIKPLAWAQCKHCRRTVLQSFCTRPPQANTLPSSLVTVADYSLVVILPLPLGSLLLTVLPWHGKLQYDNVLRCLWHQKDVNSEGSLGDKLRELELPIQVHCQLPVLCSVDLVVVNTVWATANKENTS